MTKKDRMILKTPKQHSFLEALRDKSLIIEFLLDQEFGTESSDDQDKNALIQAQKIVRAQEIIAFMKDQRGKDEDEPPDKG